ncbi:MAG: hypothetical protein P4L53_06775 [Candidatus Obscuribacterales bacterium]|nr:hypothetical protein [Candidatus Obscuribacterales bacterium]
MSPSPRFTDVAKFKTAANSLRTFAPSVNATYTESTGLSPEESNSSMPKWARSLFLKSADAQSSSNTQASDSCLNAHAVYSYKNIKISLQMRNFCLSEKSEGLLALTIKTNMPPVGGLLMQLEKISKRSFRLKTPFNSQRIIQPQPSFLAPLNFPGMTIAHASMVGKLNPTEKHLSASPQAYALTANNDLWTDRIFGNEKVQGFCDSIPELEAVFIGHPDYLVGGSVPIIRLAATGLFENANTFSDCARLVESVLDLQLDAIP